MTLKETLLYFIVFTLRWTMEGITINLNQDSLTGSLFPKHQKVRAAVDVVSGKKLWLRDEKPSGRFDGVIEPDFRRRKPCDTIARYVTAVLLYRRGFGRPMF